MKKKSSIPLTVSTKVTKRSHAKIMKKLQFKIMTKLVERLGEENKDEIKEVLKNNKIRKSIENLVKGRRISLVNNKK